MAARQVTKRHRNNSSVSNTLNRLKWTGLDHRRTDSRLISCHDIQNFIWTGRHSKKRHANSTIQKATQLTIKVTYQIPPSCRTQLTIKVTYQISPSCRTQLTIKVIYQIPPSCRTQLTIKVIYQIPPSYRTQLTIKVTYQIPPSCRTQLTIKVTYH